MDKPAREAMSWLYRKSEFRDLADGGALWTVGFYAPDGAWISSSDHSSQEAAANRVHYLNGGGYPLISEPTPQKGRGLRKPPSKTP